MKGLRQTLYSSLTALCWVLSYTDGMPTSTSSPQSEKTAQTAKTSLRFQPSGSQCCKVGEGFAKKGLNCEFLEKFEVEESGTKGWDKLNFVNRRMNRQITKDLMMNSKFIRKLMVRADQCTDSSLISYTRKCCDYRVRHNQELKLCKSYSDPGKRKLCRDEANSLYP